MKAKPGEIINAKNLFVRINSSFALGPLSFSMQKGSVLGILGQNASGKSMLINCITGLVKPATGTLVVHAKRPGVAFQTPAFYKNRSVFNNLRIFTAMHGVPPDKIISMLETMDILRFRNKMFRQMSPGIKKRVEILCAMAHDPDLLILDEPTANLDQKGIIIFEKMLDQFIQDNRSLILTNHQSFELENICTHFLLINKGQLIDYVDKKSFIARYHSVNNAIKQIH